MTTLFDPLVVGALTLPNRIVMAPMTRARASDRFVPTPRMIDYYVQRASAGLIISEAAPISPGGAGWPWSPGLWSDEQVEGWKPILDALHEAGGRMVAQLWHMGRVAHPSVSGHQPVSASATTAPGDARTYEGRTPYVEARPLRVDEIPGIVEEYAHAARNAMRAGFDGVQLHGANGYLIDQFLRDSSNLRDDDYGGSIENRSRLLLEVTRALIDTVGADYTSVRLSPNGEVVGVIDSNPGPLFTYAASELAKLDIAFLEMREARKTTSFPPADNQVPLSPVIRRHFPGVLMLNGDYTGEEGQEAVASGEADAISFGRPFIANPDYVERLQGGYPLADSLEPATWNAQGDEGYADYPPYEAAAA